ncbi:hypothetical protein D3C77_533540 [compost metagenome]
MAKVGIQRLGTGQRQHHRAQYRHPDARMNDKELHRPVGIQGLQHGRLQEDAIRAEAAQHQEPAHHQWPEQQTQACGAVLLQQEQPDQHHQRQRNHPVLHPFEGDFQPLDGR